MKRPRFKNLFDIQRKKSQRVQKTYIYKCPREKKDQKKNHYTGAMETIQQEK